MRTALLSVLILPGILAADAASPAPLTAQTVSVQTVEYGAERGWVGISYEILQSMTGRVTAVVTEVNDGSPAQQAGITVGDVLVSLNGHDVQSNFGSVPLQVRPGDPVQVVVSRDGREQRVGVVAIQRPAEFRSQPSITLTMTTDSMEESMFRAMDSLRLTLVTPEGQEVRVLGEPGTVESRLRVVERIPPGAAEAPMRFMIRSGEAVQELALDEVRAPFGFFVFRTEGQDSLRRAMERFNREIRDLRIREADRLPLLIDESGTVRADQADDELVELREVLKSYVDRSVALRQAIDRATQEASQPRTGYAVSWQDRVDTGELEETPRSLFGPLTPYALGQNRAAGAEVVDLRPELADYFQVEGGVLVVDVLPRTPASIAGIQPGDVITHIDRVTIRSLQELRIGLVRAGESVPITVVRRGDAIQLLLHR